MPHETQHERLRRVSCAHDPREQSQLLRRAPWHAPQAPFGVPQSAVCTHQLSELCFVECQPHHHHRIEFRLPRYRGFVDDELDGGVSVSAQRVVPMPYAHERIAEAACQFQGAGL